MLKKTPIASILAAKFLRFTVLITLLISISQLASAQCNQLIPLEVINPGFEGPTGPHITPNPWSTCGITPDTQPGSWGVTLPASEGNTYVGFVYGSSSWEEGASQLLSGAMQAGVQYDFTIDLSATPASGGGINPNSFCQMEVWASHSICTKEEFLWSSPTITHYGWQTYNVSITPSQNYDHIYFICNCGPLGYILLDNITPLQANNPNVFITSHVDGDSENCSFLLEGNVNNAIIDSVILTGNFQGSPINAPMNGLDWSSMITFNGPGSQTITATAYYLDQQLQQTCVYADVDITVNAPTSDFSFTSECEDTPISFVDQSTPFGSSTVTDWSWDFGDSNTSTQQNPSHQYAGEGTYTVSLEITTSDGCSVTSSQDVDVYEIPVADFTFNEACEGDITDFTDATTLNTGTIQTWAWDFGDNNTANVQNPTNSYTNLGVYPVELTVTSDNGCTHSITQDVGMYPLPVADFSFADACLQTDFEFEDQSTISSGSVDTWDWDFGDGNTATDQDPTNQYASDGTFDVMLTVTSDHACSDDITQTITVHPLPTADFTYDTVCALITMPFTDASSVSSGSITGWDWYFGDGETENTQNPTNVYATGDTYTGSLVVTTALGCQDSVATDVIVYPKPEVDFSVTPACLNDENTFTDLSTITGSTLSEWDWDFDDNQGTSTSQNPTYTYSASGLYNPTLITTTADGCKDTITQSVEVYDLPVADFTFINICEDDSVEFTDLSIIPSGSISDWQWDFGNGNTSILEEPDYQHYPADDLYDVSLVVSSGYGCSDTLEDEIEIYPVPIAEFIFDSVCYPLEVQFTDLSDPNGNYAITNWQWDFSDGQTSTAQSPSMAFPSPGTYSADLLITNGSGCKSSFSLGDAVVHPVPVADFPDELATCHEDTIFFTDESSITPITDDVIDTWNWNFDDGNTSSEPSPYHVYGSDGFYNVEFTVWSNHGCEHSVTREVEIYPLPLVDFSSTPNQGCAPLKVQFYDQSSIPNPYQLVQWDWTLGDTLVSDERNPLITYNPELDPLDYITYDIGLTVTSANGCVSDIYRPGYITVYPKPIADFSVEPEVRNIIKPEFEFTDLSTENVVNWDWSFGDGHFGNDQHPTHTYDATGTYPVGLIVETQHGCKDTIGYEVKVEPVFTFYIPNSFTPNADGVNDEFFGKGEGYTTYNMTIYDRWGEIIFQSNDDQYHWDGTYKGEQVQMGTYIYYFYLLDWQGEDHEYRGHVTLHR